MSAGFLTCRGSLKQCLDVAIARVFMEVGKIKEKRLRNSHLIVQSLVG